MLLIEPPYICLAVSPSEKKRSRRLTARLCTRAEGQICTASWRGTNSIHFCNIILADCILYLSFDARSTSCRSRWALDEFPLFCKTLVLRSAFYSWFLLFQAFVCICVMWCLRYCSDVRIVFLSNFYILFSFVSRNFSLIVWHLSLIHI